MSEGYGELVTRLCQLRDELCMTEPGRQALAGIRDQLKEMVKAQRAAGGVSWALAAELEQIRAERDAAAADLKKAACIYHFCEFCGRRGRVDAIEDSLCKTCRRQSNYRWRGRKERLRHD